MKQEVYYITAAELAAHGKENVPDELQSSKHLIYSSPATLSFNSPGAQGFGVKRAGLAIPGSVMLLVAPGCCGRNTTMLSELGGYSERFFYLLMDDTDIVTGRHLNKISKAVKEVVDSLEKTPTAVMICITCVDALLGTDMERVCRKATDFAGVPVLPCYMYALTREGRVPPMTAVRKTVYALLEPRKKKSTTVNILGEFAPFWDDCELYEILKNLGVKKINEISRCQDFEEYLQMAEANFNLILNPECRLAAEDIKRRLGIPGIELTRLYQIDKIHRQYELLGGALGVEIDDQKYYEEALNVVEDFTEKYPETTFAIGEWLNASSFELALALLRYGHKVSEIYGTITNENFIYIKKIAELSPETKIYTNLSPTMIYYDCSEETADITIGKDAEYYHPDSVNVPWNQENQPFGYSGLKHLFEELTEAMERRVK
ncbi:MAG: nitrogenase component 1 [Lachnospiraceae bacterium]|nr:nitrogenase component 1 [Lachnospiraceae bacterium]